MTLEEVAIVAGCVAMLVLGLALTVRWSAVPLSPPPGEPDGRAVTAALRCLWWLNLGISVGAATGLLVIGAGGRLAMRLLAATSGDDAQGRITEADEIVGEITLGGTLGFFIFIGLFGGALTGLLYIAIFRWLPGGPARGLSYGAVLLVVLATRIEPLRTSNEDFDLVGPAWVSLAVFGALALAQGAAVAAFAARWSRTQPLLTRPRALLRYLPMVPFLLIVPFTAVVIVLLLVSIVWSRFGISARLSGPRMLLIGRIALVAVALIALPGFLVAVADIAGR
jgi:hypothetical protein